MPVVGPTHIRAWRLDKAVWAGVAGRRGGDVSQPCAEAELISSIQKLGNMTGAFGSGKV